MLTNQPITAREHKSLEDRVDTNTASILAEQKVQSGVNLSFGEYTFGATIMLGAALIIGFFIKRAMDSWSASNVELKNSIENLAKVCTAIHQDLMSYKLEVAQRYALKSDLYELKEDLYEIIDIKNRRKDDNNVN